MTDAFFQTENAFDDDTKTWDETTAELVLEANIRHLVRLRGARHTALQLYRVADLCAAENVTSDVMVAPPKKETSRLGPKLIGLMLFIGSLAASLDLVFDVLMFLHH